MERELCLGHAHRKQFHELFVRRLHARQQCRHRHTGAGKIQHRHVDPFRRQYLLFRRNDGLRGNAGVAEYLQHRVSCPKHHQQRNIEPCLHRQQRQFQLHRRYQRVRQRDHLRFGPGNHQRHDQQHLHRRDDDFRRHATAGQDLWRLRDPGRLHSHHRQRRQSVCRCPKRQSVSRHRQRDFRRRKLCTF